MSVTATATHSPELTNDAMTERSAPRLFEPKGLTLEDMILGAWEDLRAGSSAECPVCGGKMRAASGCGNCGADLS